MIKNNKLIKKYIYIYFPKIQYSKFQGKPVSHPAPSICKWNKIINFVLSVKLGETQIIFFTIYRKNLKTKNILFYSFTYFFFRMFFSKVNNKNNFFWGRSPEIALLKKCFVYYSPERKIFLTNNMHHEVANIVCFKTLSAKQRKQFA